uniref:TPM domain-containing protein n=1 Tax=Cucumis melo TaxID=3656 RepID=A0A9I9DW44_CUCME
MAFMHLHHHLPSPSLSFSRSSLPLCRSSSRFSPPSSPFPSKKYTDFGDRLLHLPQKPLSFVLSGALALGITLSGVGFADAKVGVNKPELLPKEFTSVIDVAGFLSDGQEIRLKQEIADIEKDTGYKLRVLAQNYPATPGLAVKDFWQVDDRTIVFVADPTFGNILNFNVGATVDLDIPRSFWSRLAGKYGNIFYWKEKGEDSSIESAVMAISSCLREPVGPNNCSEINSSGRQGTVRAPFCWNPYSSFASSNSLKNSGLDKNSKLMTNLFLSSPSTANTTKWPSSTSFGTVAAASNSS